MSNRVFVLDTSLRQLMPTTSARAGRLLKAGKAAVYRLRPFTIVLKYAVEPANQPIELRTDPGSKTTGIALVAEFPRGSEVIWAAELHHRGQRIKARMDSRRALRRGRRNRKTRYRKPRFLNRTRPKGWLPPSLMSRVLNVQSWAERLQRFVPLTSIATETVRFDTQKIVNPEISGIEYQRGELADFELREYLLQKWNHQCAYCDARDVALEKEHMVSKRNGGSDRASNLCIACRPCNERKGSRNVTEFLDHDPMRLKRVTAQAKAPLKDAAAVNATRYAIGDALKSLGLPVTFWSGGRTKYNRSQQGYPKAHWIDAATVGEQGANVKLNPEAVPLTIKAMGRGTRQTVRTDRFGFPRGKAGRVKRVRGFQSGDLVRLDQPRGKHAGTYTGRLAGIRKRGDFDIAVATKITSSWKNFSLLQRTDGYQYG